MAAIDTTRYSDLCRLCGIKTSEILGINIFAAEGIVRQIYKKIEICLPVQVHETDQLPKMICKQCLVKLDFFVDFREKTIRTENLLIELYKELNAAGILNEQMKMNIVLDHPEYVMIQQHNLINENIQGVAELDLNHIGPRENMIVEHQIILGHEHVEINTHSLDNIDLSNHELTSQDISNHSLQNQDNILVDDTNASHEIPTSQFLETNLELIHQDHQLNAYTLNDIGLNDEGIQDKDTNIIENNKDFRTIHIPNHPPSVEKVTLHCQNGEKQFTLEIDSDSVIKDLIKQEDSNSENSLSLEEKNIFAQTIGIMSGDKETCSLCGKTLDKNLFQQHYDNHFIKCVMCLAVFANKSALDEHSKEVHGASAEKIKEDLKDRLKKETGTTNNQCNSDSEDVNDTELSNVKEEIELSNVKEEIEQTEVSDGGKVKKWSPKVCKVCGKVYKTNYKLTEHMRKHTGEKPYKCRSCDKAFRSKIGLAQHEATHTGQYDFACSVCGKGFQCKSYLMVHQRVHSDIKPYPCTTCGRNFKSKQSLLDHTNRHLGVKPYICEICKRGFITKSLCRAHQKVHTGLDNRKNSCGVCNKMFVSKSYLQTHMRIHTGEKPFMCEVCGKGFLTRVDLRIHSTMHTGEKSYVCEICGKAFARRDALRCHRRSHTGERPYTCDQCGQTFTQFSPMAIHKRLHTGERPYSCEECGKKFVSKSTLMSHTKKHDFTKNRG